MSAHPLFELATDPQVKNAKDFRQAAAELKGEALAEKYREEVAHAPRRHEAGQRYLVGPRGKRRRAGKSRHGDDRLALALVDYCQGGARGLSLPDGGQLDLLDQRVPLRTRKAAAEGAEASPAAEADRRIRAVDLFGIGPGDRLAIGVLKYLPADATRGAPGDTPLRALLEGLGGCAVAAANREALASEVTEHFDRTVSEQPPVLFVLGSSRYWELCRKREAQKGAAWIAQLERLAREIEESLGVPVRYVGFELSGDPPWEERDGAPVLVAEPKLEPAWETGAGRVRPPVRRKSAAPAGDPIVEADPSRPMRSYELSGTYAAGDRIDHPTLGTGVVQGVVGLGKIKVLFDGKPHLLVHERRRPE